MAVQSPHFTHLFTATGQSPAVTLRGNTVCFAATLPLTNPASLYAIFPQILLPDGTWIQLNAGSLSQADTAPLLVDLPKHSTVRLNLTLLAGGDVNVHILA